MSDMLVEENTSIREQFHMKINMLSPERAYELSSGEVKTSETLNYKEYHPASDGLFSERIFGPMKDWECRCGKYKKKYFAGVICDRCGVEVTTSNVRRERFGHIELDCNVVLPQYFYGEPSILATVLDLPQKYVEQIVLMDLPVDAEEYWLYENKMKALTNPEDSAYSFYRGTEAIKFILQNLDLDEELNKVNEILEISYGYLAQPYLHRKEVIESFIKSGNKPEWMITSRILVLPAGLRPIVDFNGKKYSSDLNDRYKIIIERNRLLHRFHDMSAPEVVLRSQKRMVQVAVDALFDSKLEKEDYEKVLTESLINRRQRKINRYVDYSASGQVIADSRIEIGYLGVPEFVVKELFRPFIAAQMVNNSYGKVTNIKSALKLLDKHRDGILEAQRGKIKTISDAVSDALNDLEKTFVVLVTTPDSFITALNICITSNSCFTVNPVLYRMWNMESEYTKNIKVFAQLSDDAAEESLEKFGIRNQVLSDYTDDIQLKPSGFAIKWLIQMSKIVTDKDRMVISQGEAYCAYENKCLTLNEKITIHCHTTNGFDYEEETSLGRIILNEILPQNMGIINRASLKNKYYLEHNYEFDEKKVKGLFRQIYDMFGADTYINVITKLESAAGKYSNVIPMRTETGIIGFGRKKNSDYLKDELQTIKQRCRDLCLTEKEPNVIEMKTQYQDQRMTSYVRKYLHNRTIAQDIYDFADILIAKGEQITDKVFGILDDKNINIISVYDGDITSQGEYPKKAFGKYMQGNPFKISIMALAHFIDKVDYDSANDVVRLLLSDTVEVDDNLSKVVKATPSEGFIGRAITKASQEDGVIKMSLLATPEQVHLRTYLVFKLLETDEERISLRLLELLVKVCVTNDISTADGRQLILHSKDNDLQIFGEYALKSIDIPLNSETVVEEFGAVNIIKEEKQDRFVSNVTGDDDELFTDDELSLDEDDLLDEDELMDDDLYDFDDFE